MRVALVLALVLAASSAGCIQNMGEFKQFLGVVPPPPHYESPIAKAMTNGTLAIVGSPLQFSSEGTRDPQGFPLTYAWDFGDGKSGSGASVSHAYGVAGEFTARLTVTNTKSLVDDDIVRVKIIPTNLPPTASIQLSPARGTIGAALSFTAVASDPESQPLTYAWDFGDGATSNQAQASHAFAKPGAHSVKLIVADAQGGQVSTSVTVPIDGHWTQSGAFELNGADKAVMTIPVGVGVKELVAKLTFDEGVASANDIQLVAKDASGAEIAREKAQRVTPGVGGGETIVTLTLDSSKLTPGTWTLEVVKATAPAGAAWSLDVTETA